jgi:hypothetical protein
MRPVPAFSNSFPTSRRALPPVAAATHGGITVDLLRTLLGDAAVPVTLLHDGVPACAVTTLQDLNVIDVADIAHLR